MDEQDDAPNDPASEAIRAAIIAGIKAKVRLLAVFLALATGTFVWFAVDAGKPLWLVLPIGFFGAVLIAFLFALVWFWLRFFSYFGRKGA